MAARQRLSKAQIAELYDPPTEQRELVRHFTLSDADLAANRRCRGDHNRLGQALMLGYLRHPGRPLRPRERPPAALLAFVADQIDVSRDCIDSYLDEERNRQRHSIECQERLGLRPFGTVLHGSADGCGPSIFSYCYGRRTYSGRPSSSIRFSALMAIATSLARR